MVFQNTNKTIGKVFWPLDWVKYNFLQFLLWTMFILSSQVHWEAAVQKWKADCSSGAKEGRVWTDQCYTKQTWGWLLCSADGPQIQVLHTWQQRTRPVYTHTHVFLSGIYFDVAWNNTCGQVSSQTVFVVLILWGHDVSLWLWLTARSVKRPTASCCHFMMPRNSTAFHCRQTQQVF